MRKSLGILALLLMSVQAQAAMFPIIPPPRGEAITLEDYLAREKRCKELGGKPEPFGERIGYNKVVVTGLSCTYNGSVFEIPKQQEQLTSKDASSE